MRSVPDDHSVREIAAVLDLSWVHAELAPYYSPTRPALDRSGAHDPDAHRRLRVRHPLGAALCREVQVNLAYRWFCGLSIEDKIPDHSAFSRARNERFRDSDIFRRVFERVVEALHCGRPGRRRRVCGRCQPDCGGRQQAAVDPGLGVGQGARSQRRRAGP